MPGPVVGAASPVGAGGEDDPAVVSAARALAATARDRAVAGVARSALSPEGVTVVALDIVATQPSALGRNVALVELVVSVCVGLLSFSRA